MNKKDFMVKLKSNLKHLQKEELDEVISDYKEHFDIAKKKGRKEHDVAKALGSPKQIAKQIMADYHVKKAETHTSTPNVIRAIFATAGLGFLNLVFVLGPFLGALGVLVGLIVTSISIFIAGIVTLMASIIGLTIPGYYLKWPASIAGIFFGIGTIFLGALASIGVYYLAKLFFKLTLKYLRWNIKIITGGEN